MPLPINRFHPIWARVNVRLFLSMVVAMALAFAPFAMPVGEAHAAVATGHHQGMATAGHCDDAPAPAKADHHKEKPCCTAGCMAAAMIPPTGEVAAILPHATERPGLDRFRRGFLGEIATPPPRLS